jgi:inositol phosphorylceramide mannosyltransferase catalytic subunit
MKWLYSCVALLMCLSFADAKVRESGFDSGMNPDGKYAKYSSSYPNEWNRVKDLFATYLKKKSRSHLSKAKYRIPKKIHLIWLGSPPPEFVQTMFKSWKRNHPQWEVKLWTDGDLGWFHLKNQKAYDTARNWGEKSDIFRYEILEREGGIHADTDFECIRPFDDICKSADFFAGVGYSEGPPFLYNGLIGCCPGHPIIRRCVDTLQVGNGDNNFLRILNTTGPTFFTKCVNECLWPSNGGALVSDSGIVAPFPLIYFYPFPDVLRWNYPNTEAIKRDWLHPETYAIHYWKISWQ